MGTNRAFLIGHLAADAKFDVLKNNTPCVKFSVTVPRSPEHVSAKFLPYAGEDGRVTRDQIPSELKKEFKDLVQVAGYGPRAAEWAGGLHSGACVAVDGWTEERRFFDREVGRYRVTHEINVSHLITIDFAGTGPAPVNLVHIIGWLEKDPLFELLRGATPCLRLRIRVPREPRQVSAELAPYVARDGNVRRSELPPELRGRLVDHLSISIYGQRALLYSRYLRADAQVAVDGWTEERHYYDREVKRERRVQEINAVHVVCGPGSDFAAGDAYRSRLVAEGSLAESVAAEIQPAGPEGEGIYGD